MGGSGAKQNCKDTRCKLTAWLGETMPWNCASQHTGHGTASRLCWAWHAREICSWRCEAKLLKFWSWLAFDVPPSHQQTQVNHACKAGRSCPCAIQPELTWLPPTFVLAAQFTAHCQSVVLWKAWYSLGHIVECLIAVHPTSYFSFSCHPAIAWRHINAMCMNFVVISILITRYGSMQSRSIPSIWAWDTCGSAYVMTEHEDAVAFSIICKRGSATSYTHHGLQGVSVKTTRAFEPGTYDAVSSRHRHASPQLLAGRQGAHQGLQELVPRSHVPCQTLPSPAGDVPTFTTFVILFYLCLQLYIYLYLFL